MKKYNIIILFIIFFFCTCSLIYGSDNNINLSLNIKKGDVNGYVQIPSGGKKGSTSYKRPTLKELDINNSTLFESSLWFNKDCHSIGFSIHPTTLSGSNVLEQDLIFHALNYYKGTKVDFDLKLDWYEFGYQYKYYISDKFNISPTIRVVLWDFKAEITANNISDNRNFHSGCGRIGLITQYNINEWFYISTETIISLPSNLQIYTFKLNGNIKLIDNKKYQVSIFSGLSYEKIYFKDNQYNEQNNINIKFSPMLYGGIRLSF